MELMALSEIIEFHYGQIGIWKLTEPASDLLNQYTLSEREKNEYAKINNEKRKKEYLAVRLLLWNMLDEKTEIIYNTSRKPFLKSKNLNISISHSDNLAAVIVSENIPGIDVEDVERSINNIASRILTEEEFNDSLKSRYPQKKQIIYWCAKEAAFKCIKVENFNFKSVIKICPFNYSEAGGEFHGEYYEQGNACLLIFKYFFYKNNVIVYCVK